MKRRFDFDDILVVSGGFMGAAGLWLIYEPLALITIGILLAFLGIRGSKLRRKG